MQSPVFLGQGIAHLTRVDYGAGYWRELLQSVSEKLREFDASFIKLRNDHTRHINLKSHSAERTPFRRRSILARAANNYHPFPLLTI